VLLLVSTGYTVGLGEVAVRTNELETDAWPVVPRLVKPIPLRPQLPTFTLVLTKNRRRERIREMATSVRRRVYFSLPVHRVRNGSHEELPLHHQDLLHGLADEVKSLGYEIEVFARIGITDSPTAYTPWSFQGVERVMRGCAGVVFVGFPRWILESTTGSELRLTTEYSHYEGALAVTLNLPRLILLEQHATQRGIFSMSHGDYITLFPEGADATWLQKQNFQGPFKKWQQQVEDRRDLFLGYSGSSKGTAQNLRRYLNDMGATVLDWQSDFVPGGTILDAIQDAARRCGAGIFLFTQDDKLMGEDLAAAPRDNVVFEAGYFSAAKGKRRTLIVRENGAKMPADLGGDMYASLSDRADISSIEAKVKMFLESL
jgi:hypothetical protein